MDFLLDDALQMLRQMVHDFADEHITPFADKWDEDHYRTQCRIRYDGPEGRCGPEPFYL
jgi:alkylation response protein AidB-like acyl-CoA dehydrogenase